MTNEDLLNAPPASIIAVASSSKAHCASIVVTTGDGRRFNLGKPDSFLFPLRRRLYLWRRRKELRSAS